LNKLMKNMKKNSFKIFKKKALMKRLYKVLKKKEKRTM